MDKYLFKEKEEQISEVPKVPGQKSRLRSRIIITLVVVLALPLLLAGFLEVSQYYYYYIERGSRKEIEAMTGIDFPAFKTVEKRHFTYGPGFNSDFTMEWTVKMDTADTLALYARLDTKIQQAELEDSEGKAWTKVENGNYYCSYIGVCGKDDQTLELHIDRGSGYLRIVYGGY